MECCVGVALRKKSFFSHSKFSCYLHQYKFVLQGKLMFLNWWIWKLCKAEDFWFNNNTTIAASFSSNFPHKRSPRNVSEKHTANSFTSNVNWNEAINFWRGKELHTHIKLITIVRSIKQQNIELVERLFVEMSQYDGSWREWATRRSDELSWELMIRC